MASIPVVPSQPNAMDIMAPSGVGQARFDQTNQPIAATLGLSPGNTVQSIPTGTERNSPIGPAIFKWDKYNFMLNAYFSTGGFYDGTALVKSTIEKDDQYLERRSTCYYRNFFRSIVDATYTPVFSIGATRKVVVNGKEDPDGTTVPVFTAFKENVDAKGNCIDLFIEKVVKYSRVLGVSFAVMDNYPAEEIPSVTGDVVSERKFPFVYMRLPQQVEPPLLQIDDFGNIDQIGFREKPEIIVKEGKQVEDPRWKVWGKNGSVMYRMNDKKEFEMIPGTEVFYDFGKVPVVPVYSSEVEDDTFLPHPTYYDIARCNWALFNIDSAQMRLIRSQMFAMLCMSRVEGQVAASPQNGIELPSNTPENSYPLPFYLAPPTGPYSELGNTVKDLKEDLYRLANQHGVTGVQSGAKTAKSGVAMQFDFQANNWVLKKSAQMASMVENRLADLFQLYVPSEKFVYSSEYEANYMPGNLDDEIKSTSDYLALNPGTIATIEAKKKVSASYFEGLDEEKLAEILEDITQAEQKASELPTQEEMEAQAQANANDDAMNFLMDKGKVPSNKVVKTLPFGKKAVA